MEPTLGYHSSIAAILTDTVEARIGTLSGGQFDWGGRLLKCNGGARKVRSGRSATVRRAQEYKRA